MTYGSPVWPSASNVHKRKLDTLQNKILIHIQTFGIRIRIFLTLIINANAKQGANARMQTQFAQLCLQLFQLLFMVN